MKPYLIALLLMNLQHVFAQEFFFRQMPVEYGKDVQLIKNIFQSADQLIWLGTDKGLFSFDGRTYHHFPREDGKSSAVTAIAQQENSIWIGYEDGHIQYIYPGHAVKINTDSIRNIPVSKILFNNSGVAFIATYGAGLWKFDKGLLTRIPVLHAARLHDIYDALIDHTGKIWFATDNGIWQYEDGKGKEAINLNRDHGLPDNIVTLLQKTSSHNIWIGFYDHGFARYSQAHRSVTADVSIT